MESEKSDEVISEQTREEKIVKAKELYSNGSRNFLIKNYTDAADELSQVCEIFGHVYGEFSVELGMPYLLYAKSLIALALEENKVIDVPDEEEDDDDDDDDENEEEEDGEGAQQKILPSEVKQTNGISSHKNGKHLEEDEADSTEKGEIKESDKGSNTELNLNRSRGERGDAMVTSSEDSTIESLSENNGMNRIKDKVKAESFSATDEKPSTSNGDNIENIAERDEIVDAENEAASNLQLAWEILETAAKIFAGQGLSGLPNLADVQTELANIELENNIPEGARGDYEKALQIYKDLIGNYRRAMAEIHYKIGLTFLMQQMNQEAANSLKEACTLIESEINEINSKENITEKDKNNIQDMQETKQEILDKITEIEETRDQNIAEVRAALKSFISPEDNKKMANETNNADPSSTSTTSDNGSISSSSSSTISSSTKPNDITHLIKRKKPDSPMNSEAEAVESPMKKRSV